MRNASKGLVLFFVGAGWNTPRRWERAVRVPKSSDVFIRVAAPMVVDLGILGVMLHEIPMMPISFYSSPPGVSSQRLIEEELPACERTGAREGMRAREGIRAWGHECM
ncbi:hypothetical protein CLOP_g12883 [Closterium sp. NIES-67]|nr:hypothetical protein CLOP_g12883 [Closterium sp. NIES-67]